MVIITLWLVYDCSQCYASALHCFTKFLCTDIMVLSCALQPILQANNARCNVNSATNMDSHYCHDINYAWTLPTYTTFCLRSFLITVGSFHYDLLVIEATLTECLMNCRNSQTLFNLLALQFYPQNTIILRISIRIWLQKSFRNHQGWRNHLCVLRITWNFLIFHKLNLIISQSEYANKWHEKATHSSSRLQKLKCFPANLEQRFRGKSDNCYKVAYKFYSWSALWHLPCGECLHSTFMMILEEWEVIASKRALL